MYDIITFGSSSQDVHLRSDKFKVLKDEKDFNTGEGLCFTLGSKIDVDEIIFSSGGGATNTAATFARQGFKTAFFGAVGNDPAAQDILNELKNLKIDTKLVLRKKEKRTNYSVIVSSAGDSPRGEAGDRTILAYRGASDLVAKEDIPWNKLKTKWFYLAPLSGGFCSSFEAIVAFAKEKGIKVAANPSMQQLSLPESQLKDIFSKIDVLFLNQEEASFLTKLPFTEEQEIFKKIDEICPGVAVMTKGGEGVVVSDGKYLYSALPNPNRKIVDTTGAGDSFASGFLSDFIKSNGNIEKAIQLGLANSEGNLAEVGAKTGLLDKNDKFNAVPVAKQLCTENNLCLPK